MIISSSIHVATNGIILFFSWLRQYSIAQMYHVFIHSSADECLDCVHALAIVNSAAMSRGLLRRQVRWSGITISYRIIHSLL